MTQPTDRDAIPRPVREMNAALDCGSRLGRGADRPAELAEELAV